MSPRWRAQQYCNHPEGERFCQCVCYPRPATRARTTKRRAREQAALFVPARRPSRLVHDSSRRRRRRRRVRLSVRRRYPMSKGLPSVLILDPDTRAELVQAREHPLLESLFRLSQFPISSNLARASPVLVAL